jgi:hypothetical protein
MVCWCQRNVLVREIALSFFYCFGQWNNFMVSCHLWITSANEISWFLVFLLLRPIEWFQYDDEKMLMLMLQAIDCKCHQTINMRVQCKLQIQYYGRHVEQMSIVHSIPFSPSLSPMHSSVHICCRRIPHSKCCLRHPFEHNWLWLKVWSPQDIQLGCLHRVFLVWFF